MRAPMSHPHPHFHPGADEGAVGRLQYPYTHRALPPQGSRVSWIAMLTFAGEGGAYLCLPGDR
jgi:hypothetical protein